MRHGVRMWSRFSFNFCLGFIRDEEMFPCLE